MRLVLAILAAIVMLLAGCGTSTVAKVASSPRPTATPGSRLKAFTSRAYGFSITYDADQLQRSGSAASGLSDPKHGLLVVDLIKENVGGIEITAVREAGKVGPDVLGQVLRHAMKGTGVPPSGGEPATVGGLPGLTAEGTGQGKTRLIFFAVGHGRYAYTIMIGADAGKWDTLRPVMEAAVRSFTLLK